MAKPALLILALSLVLLTAAAPSRRGPDAVVLDYADFGPQVMAHELLGMELYQWESESPDPHATFDIRVVVHNGLSPKSLAARYPVVKGKRDHRYLLRAKALAYLDARLLELRDVPPAEGAPFVALAVRLAATRERIVAVLGK